MTRCSDHQRLRLCVPATPRTAAVRALPVLWTPARMRWHETAGTAPNHSFRRHRALAEPNAPCPTTSARLIVYLENP